MTPSKHRGSGEPHTYPNPVAQHRKKPFKNWRSANREGLFMEDVDGMIAEVPAVESCQKPCDDAALIDWLIRVICGIAVTWPQPNCVQKVIYPSSLRHLFSLARVRHTAASNRKCPPTYPAETRSAEIDFIASEFAMEFARGYGLKPVSA